MAPEEARVMQSPTFPSSSSRPPASEQPSPRLMPHFFGRLPPFLCTRRGGHLGLGPGHPGHAGISPFEVRLPLQWHSFCAQPLRVRCPKILLGFLGCCFRQQCLLSYHPHDQTSQPTSPLLLFPLCTDAEPLLLPALTLCCAASLSRVQEWAWKRMVG